MLNKKLEYKICGALQQFCVSGLLKGDMGVCIYYFVSGRMRNDSHMTQLGNASLKRIMSKMGQNKKLFIEDGVVGIAIGISFLLKYKYVEGDVNDVLQDIDDYIYKGACVVLENETAPDTKLPTLDILIFYIVRYIDVKAPVRKRFYGKLIEHLFNYIYIHRQDSFYQESYPFRLKKDSYLFLCVLVWIYKIGIAQKRIGHILEEIKPFLFSCFPVLHANRFQLMTVARCVGKFVNDKEWVTFADRLAENVDMNYILEKELADKNILPQTGVIGIWLLKEFNLWMGFVVKDSSYDFEKRVIESSIWDRIEKDAEFFSNYYSLDGYCGVRMFLDYLRQQNEI